MNILQNTFHVIADFALNYRSTFLLLTVLECSVFASVVLIPLYDHQIPRIKRWVTFFGLTFLILALIAMIRFGDVVWRFPSTAFADISRIPLSFASNLLLF